MPDPVPAIPDPGGPKTPPSPPDGAENYWGYPPDDTRGIQSLMQRVLPAEGENTPEPAAPAPAAPAVAAPAAAPPAPAFDPQQLMGEIAGLRAELDRVRAAPSQPGSQPQEITRAMVQALDEFSRAREGRAAAEQALAPPRIEDPEALISDPAALQRHLDGLQNWAQTLVDTRVRGAQNELWQHVAPQLQQAAAVAQLAGPVIASEMTRARSDAKIMAKQRGIDEALFNELLPIAEATIENANLPPAQKFHMRMDGNTMLQAVEFVRNARGGGVPLAPPAPAPPSAPAPSIPAVAAVPKNQYVNLAEQALGIKFTPKMMAELGTRLARGDN